MTPGDNLIFEDNTKKNTTSGILTFILASIHFILVAAKEGKRMCKMYFPQAEIAGYQHTEEIKNNKIYTIRYVLNVKKKKKRNLVLKGPVT